MFKYSSEVLGTIQKCLTLEKAFDKTYLLTKDRSNIIASGIRKQKLQVPYRRSRAKQKLFHHINSIVNHHLENVTNCSTTRNSPLVSPFVIPLQQKTNIPSANRISLATVNAQSIYSKKEDFQEYLLSNDLDICLVMETWLKHLDTHTDNEVPLPNYNIISQTRSAGRTGGRLVLVYKDNPKIKITKHQQHDSQPDITEIHSFNITIHQMPINLYAVYRIPNSSVISFCETLSNILTENIVTNHARPILLGDFNIHTDKLDNPDMITFLDFLDSLNLINKVNFPTHTSGHTLDLIIEDKDLQLLSDVQHGFLLLDHHFILSKLLIAKLKPPTKEIATRQLKKIDSSKFQTDLMESLQTLSYNDNLQNIVCQYNKELKDVLDHHAPISMKKVKPSRHQPWYSERIRDEIKIRQYKERLFRHYPNEYSLQAYKNQCRWVSSLIKQAQKEYYCDLFCTYQHDFKKVYQLTNSMLFRKQELPLPTSNDNSALAEKFSVFFNDKIVKIMTQLEASSVADSMYIENEYITTARHNFFLPVTEEDVRRIIMKSPAKACELDSIPMKLLKDNLDILLPTLTSIVCKSLSTGKFSDNLKEALLRPLLKAIQLNHEEFPNF